MTNSPVIVRVQNPIEILGQSMPEPDLAVVKYQADFYYSNHPVPEDILLVVEVALSSYSYDKTVKGPLYAKAGIAEYWIVHIEQNRIEIFLDPVDDIYTTHRIYTKASEIESYLFDRPVPVVELMVLP